MINVRHITDIDDATAQQLATLKHQLSPGHTLSQEMYLRATSKPQTTILGAWNGDVLVGVALLNAAYTLDKAYGDIDDVVIDEAYRGQGISKLLLDALVAEARQLGLDKLRLTSAAHRVAANNLYRSYGFKLFETNTYRFDL